ncbi:response regulator [Paenibacillus psychroresistens]|uniref:Circadian input-output histidine kinase CikA n=1 Tax=Paenibacillus psychroresistens TaxID=1778678 RepID=A0A6B8RQI2_9BACL|nr:CHASE3 domain-containing protein [Paenibacillus psychroresistens]QGQ98630.1 response regulator [Paenibacillus psychroresistens]
MFTNRRFNIRSKIILGNVIVVIILAISVFVVNGRIAALQHEIDFISNHDIEVHDVTNQMEKNEFNMETGQRGYIITGNQSYLDLYSDGSIKWVESYQKLHELVSDNPVQQKNLSLIKSTIEEWMSVVGDPTIALKKASKTEELNQFFAADPGKKYIEQMRNQFETFLATEKKLTTQRVSSVDHSNYLLKISLYLLLVVVSLISIVIALIISKSIITTLNQVKQMIKAMSSENGDFSKRIEITTKDEISDLGHATNELLESVERFAWLQSNAAEVVSSYQGINNITNLADAFIAKVALLVEASYGVVYIREERRMKDEFVRQASYALYGEHEAGLSFRLGEGLIGQSALDKRTIIIEQVPNHYYRIVSGLGQASPQSLLIVPVIFMNRVEAVIEFASFKAFTQIQQTFIEQIQSNFGAAIHSVTGRMEVERLLNESQTMTEELQAQSEELQAQSEELQMQQEEMLMINENLDKQNQLALIKTAELEKAKDELESSSAELQKSSQYKSDFLANMSHELRTPLNSILILSQMLAENNHKTLTVEEERFSKTIYDSGKDLLNLIDDILDLSKVEAGKIDVIISELNVTEIPDLMKLSFDPIAQSKAIGFDVIIGEGVPEIISTDGQRLQQILKNLLSNAFKFTEQGKVTMKIEKAEPKLVKQLLPKYKNELALAFSIIDTGIGIPLEKQQLIFDAFKQVDGTISRRYGGTGLGLSISLSFARLLGGCLILESEMGKGSNFTLYLPCLSSKDLSSAIQLEIAASSVIRPLYPRAGEVTVTENDIFLNKKVLLAEDDSRNVYALVHAFEAKGITLKVASNGQECLDILRADPSFDLVLMDVMMPVMNGYEAMSAIRMDSILKDMPIIALTAKAMKMDRQKCLEAGASDYISKPIDMAQLYSLMRVWIKQ